MRCGCWFRSLEPDWTGSVGGSGDVPDCWGEKEENHKTLDLQDSLHSSLWASLQTSSSTCWCLLWRWQTGDLVHQFLVTLTTWWQSFMSKGVSWNGLEISPYGGMLGLSNWEKTPGQTHSTHRGDYISHLDLGMPKDPPERSWRHQGHLVEPATTHSLDTRQKMGRWWIFSFVLRAELLHCTFSLCFTAVLDSFVWNKSFNVFLKPWFWMRVM